MNAYEAGIRKVIPSVLLYAFFEGKVLMIHRNQNPKDFHLGKWNGLGGKQEPGESPQMCAAREFFEESGCKIQPEQWTWLGQLQFPDFKPHRNEDWFVTVLITDLDENALAQIQTQNSEGTLHWVPLDQVMTLNLWEGDRVFIPSVIKKKPFSGTFFYENGQLTRALFNPILN